MKRPRPSSTLVRHRGTSLVECILYLFLLNTIGLLGFQVLNRLFRLQTSETRSEQQELQRVRLERQWREDVHQAEEFTLAAGDAASSVTLAIGPHEIVYSAGDEGVVLRTSRAGAELRGTERWEVDGEVRFQSSPDRRRLTLELQPLPLLLPSPGRPGAAPPPKSASSHPPVLFDAAVGTERQSAPMKGGES